MIVCQTKTKVPFYILIPLNFIILSYFYIFVNQRSLIMGERNLWNPDPSDTKLNLTASDGIKLDAYMIAKKSDVDCVVFLGNDSIREDVLEFCLIIMMAHKYNMIYYRMRGTANNEGTASEVGIDRDLRAISQFLNKRSTRKVGIGFSYGGALMTRIARYTNFECIVLHNAFISTTEVWKQHFLARLCIPICVDIWNTGESIKKLNCKIKILVCNEDKNVQPYNFDILHRNSKDSILVSLPGRGHFNVVGDIDNVRKYLVPLLAI